MRCIYSAALVILALAQTALSLSKSDVIVHEERDTRNDRQWIRVSRLGRHVLIPVRIGLTQSNIDNGRAHALLMDVSDPASSNYGKHFSHQEVVDLFAPPQESIDVVGTWLERSGIALDRISLSRNKQWIAFDARTPELESLLHTEYYEYTHSQSGQRVVACERYSLPENVQRHIDFVKPGISLSTVRPKLSHPSKEKRAVSDSKRRGRILPRTEVEERVHSRNPTGPEKLSAPEQCSFVMTPDCIKKLYNVTDGVKPVKGNSIGIYASFGQIYSGEELDNYFRVFLNGKIPQGTRPRFVSINGAPKYNPRPGHDLSEANLDVQLAYSLVYPINVSFWSVDDYHYQYNAFRYGQYNTFLDAIDGSYCNFTAFGITGDSPKIDPTYPDKHKHGYHHPEQCGVYEPAPVYTFSYINVEEVLPLRYQLRQCLEFLKLGLQGITLIFGSGDSGVGELPYCKDRFFEVSYPRGCPYITDVGGTALPPGQPPVAGSERATTDFASGGGFSNIFTQPDYQRHAVQKYLDNHPPPYKSYKTKNDPLPSQPHGRYNRIGRGFPDLAAIGQAIPLYSKSILGEGSLVYGTSASGPIFGSLITRINNHRMAAGKSPVGFINPTVYANPQMFNDITIGNNPGCGTDGFSCAPGWDPVTGLGTPDYEKMLEVFMNLP